MAHITPGSEMTTDNKGVHTKDELVLLIQNALRREKDGPIFLALALILEHEKELQCLMATHSEAQDEHGNHHNKGLDENPPSTTQPPVISKQLLAKLQAEALDIDHNNHGKKSTDVLS